MRCATTGRRRPEGGTPSPDPLTGYRRAALALFLVIDAFVIGADVLGGYLKDGYGVDPIIIGLAFGTTLTLLGLEGFSRIFGGPDK